MKPGHRRHPKFVVFDEVRMTTVPRYKTSELSGDEWRTSVRVQLLFKEVVIVEKSFSAMAAAVMYLGPLMDELPIPDKVLDLEKGYCDQPGCANAAVSKYRLKKLYSAHGEELAERDKPWPYEYRQFCRKHLRRGDGALEDADDNYEIIEGPGPDASTNKEESPAVFGGVIDLTDKHN